MDIKTSFTIEELLKMIDSSDDILDLKYSVGLLKPKTLQPQKYVNSTLNGSKIKNIIVFENGLCYLETHNDKQRYWVNRDNINSADSILCEIQNLPGINVSK